MSHVVKGASGYGRQYAPSKSIIEPAGVSRHSAAPVCSCNGVVSGRAHAERRTTKQSALWNRSEAAAAC